MSARRFFVGSCAVLGVSLAVSATAFASPSGSGSGGLPDNRGYEKVSPNDNNDGNVGQPITSALSPTPGGYNYQPFVAAADGEALAYMADPSETGGGGHEGASEGDQYISSRDAGGGWSVVNATPPTQNTNDYAVYQGFSNNLSLGYVVSKTTLAPGAPSGGYQIPYVRDFSSGGYESLLLVTPPNRSAEEFGNESSGWSAPGSTGSPPQMFAGASSDFSRVFYQANDALTQDAVDGGGEHAELYEAHQGALNLVNVLPGGSPEADATFGGPTSENPRYNGPALANAISENGSMAYWTGLGANKNLYLREDGARTVQVDESVGGEGQFWLASSDGSKALFTKEGNLYEYNAEGHEAIDLVLGAEVQGVLGASSDLSYVYFVARGALAPGAQPQECVSGRSEGLCNLYLIHGETIKYIGALNANDYVAAPNSLNMKVGPWQASPGAKESEVSPNGLHLVFGTTASLAGYDNIAKEVNEEGQEESRAMEEVYVYDFEGSKLTCISCNRTGEPPENIHPKGGHSANGLVSAFLPVSRMSDYARRWMSEDGDRIFFDSVDALVPQDTNEANDVYEWERNGSGSCNEVNGCIYLITSGVGSEGSYLIDSSTSGNDVFFTTRARLVAEDENENIDAYDARVDAPVPAVAPACTGSGCQGVPSAPPIFATPASVTYDGVGNFSASGKAPASHPKKKAARPRNAKKKKRHKKRTTRGVRASQGKRIVSGKNHGRGN